MTQPAQRETGTAVVNGATLYYEVAGSGHPLVLLHAGIADSRMWDDQFDDFAHRYRVVRYDARGFGRSDTPPGLFTFHEDLYLLLRHLGIQKAHVLGCSLGGATALDFALMHPDVASALVLVGSGLGGFDWSEGEDTVIAEAEAAAKAGEFERANELELRFWVDGTNRTPEQVNPGARARASEMNLAVLCRSPEQEHAQAYIARPAAAGRLAEIAVPTLVIVGDRDTADIQRIASLLEQGIPNARKVVMANAAHLPNMEWPDQFNRTVLDFLAAL